MKVISSRPPIGLRKITTVALVCTACSLFASSAAFGVTGPAKKKALSLSAISIVADGTSGVNGDFFMAYQDNLFAKYGLTVNFINSQTGASAQMTAFLGGLGDFINTGASTTVAAAQAGAPIRAIGQGSQGNPQQIAINPTVSASLGMPPGKLTSLDTVKDTQAQLAKLKGSHIIL